MKYTSHILLYTAIILIPLFTSCRQKQKVDIIIQDATIYTMDENNSVAQSMVSV